MGDSTRPRLSASMGLQRQCRALQLVSVRLAGQSCPHHSRERQHDRPVRRPVLVGAAGETTTGPTARRPGGASSTLSPSASCCSPARRWPTATRSCTRWPGSPACASQPALSLLAPGARPDTTWRGATTGVVALAVHQAFANLFRSQVITCRTACVARLRPSQQVRSPRRVPRPADRRGRAVARLEIR